MPIARVVAIGASNLTRGFQTVVSTARAAWGPEVEVVAALGHGRSYGATSTFVIRRLPGILQSGLWTRLASAPAVPTKALVTDVGNDILYGFPARDVLAWVDDAVTRLARVSDDIVLTGLPMESIRRLSPQAFRALRSVLTPFSRLPYADVLATAEYVHAGLERLAHDRGLRFVALRPSWYGLDPIHIRPSLWHSAWQDILGVSADIRRSRIEAMRLYLMRPESQSLCGIAQRRPQTGTALSRGARVWLYRHRRGMGQSAMQPRITFITLGVDDLERAVAFYRDGLGLATNGIVGTEFEHGAVAFFNLQPGLKLALWPRRSLAADCGLAVQPASATEFSLAHNVSSEAEVDGADAAGRARRRGNREGRPEDVLRRLRWLLPGSGWPPVGSRLQSQRRVARLRDTQLP